MSEQQSARVDSIDALRAFKIALIKFADSANVALGDAESDLHRTMNWLENEQLSHWATQLRKRTEALSKAKDDLRQKKIFKDSSGRTPSAVDEEKAVAIATKRLEEAEQKLANVRKYTRVLQKEVQLYKGGVQRFATMLQSDIPVAAGQLERMVQLLEGYVSLRDATSQVMDQIPAPAGTMARGDTEEIPASNSESDNQNATPSPGTPGEGRGEGAAVGSAHNSNRHANEPSPYPSPVVPGEGTGEVIEPSTSSGDDNTTARKP